jgi:hypothetical protein
MDATNKETNLKRSIKKFFVEGLTTVPVYFDREITTGLLSNTPNQWVNVMIQAIKPMSVSIASMPVYLFSKLDPEGDALSALRDTVVELLEPGRIDLYDTSVSPWVKIGGLFLIIDGQSRLTYNPDQSKMTWIMTTLRWGAKW